MWGFEDVSFGSWDMKIPDLVLRMEVQSLGCEVFVAILLCVAVYAARADAGCFSKRLYEIPCLRGARG